MMLHVLVGIMLVQRMFFSMGIQAITFIANGVFAPVLMFSRPIMKTCLAI